MLNQGLRLVFLFLAVVLVLCTVTPLTIHSRSTEVWLWVAVVTAGLLLLVRTGLRWRLPATMAVLVGLLTVGSFLGYVLMVVSGGNWMTQEILYEHRTIPGRTIEFQMRNPGPGSYQKRRVDRQQLLPGIEWLRETPEKIDTTEWKRVNREVNELGLKYACLNRPCNIMALTRFRAIQPNQRP